MAAALTPACLVCGGVVRASCRPATTKRYCKSRCRGIGAAVLNAPDAGAARRLLCDRGLDPNAADALRAYHALTLARRELRAAVRRARRIARWGI